MQTWFSVKLRKQAFELCFTWPLRESRRKCYVPDWTENVTSVFWCGQRVKSYIIVYEECVKHRNLIAPSLSDSGVLIE
jgi:hypothetical protein